MKLIYNGCARSQLTTEYPFQLMVSFPIHNKKGWQLTNQKHGTINSWIRHAQEIALDNGWDIAYYIHNTPPTEMSAGTVDFLFRSEIDKMRFQLLGFGDQRVTSTRRVTALTPDDLDNKEKFLRNFLIQQGMSDRVMIYRASDTQFSVTTRSLRDQLWVRMQLNQAGVRTPLTPLVQHAAPQTSFDQLLQEQGLQISKLE